MKSVTTNTANVWQCKNSGGQKEHCTYSKSMHQPYPRKCIHCGIPEQRDEPTIVFESPKPQYFIRNLATGKFVSKYSGGNSWTSLGLTMNRLKQVTVSGEGFRIEKYTFGAAEIIDPTALIVDSKILAIAKRKWEEDRRSAILEALGNIKKFRNLDLNSDACKKLIASEYITDSVKVELQDLLNKYTNANQMQFTEQVKNEYIKKIKNETK